MRFAVTVALWLATTVALAVAVPAAWTQLHLVDADGYAAMATEAAGDPALQSAMAADLTTRAMALIAARGAGRYPVDSSQLHAAAAAFTAGPGFPPLFAQANRSAHDWLFDAAGPGQGGDQWVVDVAPMLEDSSIQPLLSGYHVNVPANVAVPVAVSVPASLRRGELSRLAAWGPWLSVGAVAVTGWCALLTLAAARRRGQALTSLGVSALLVGASGYAAIEVGRRRVNDVLNHTAGDVRRIADVMVGRAEAGLHEWLDLTLMAGVGLVVSGVVVAVLGGLRKPASRT
ncbi:hypothetical protein [Mycobacterium parmense]|uniref:Uncharacterized protein n=1 Tax=Mycobacterium parmense TaxID=185642 RepID=A0A7I7YXI3_9MYCO|nr:hypothetical protein [Mycobacterium parmense]MCV7350543.1 hypothetical protein [Mycobacterium parmense]ORW48261.1 hypothetical protein AWC20_25275 [Mycobacterium parmense]BBZ46032.1 hypothetical protein MPRM_33130 [Mycobacterium parmense]